VVGDKAGLEWCHDRPEELRLTRLGEPTQIVMRGGPGYAGKSRVPGGHPEGFLEAFASLYTDAADAIEAGALPSGLPGVQEGVQGLRFIDASLKSHAEDGRWTLVVD
jgi:predicted dehydrogenase